MIKDILKNRIREYYLKGYKGYTDEALAAFVAKGMITQDDMDEFIAEKRGSDNR